MLITLSSSDQVGGDPLSPATPAPADGPHLGGPEQRGQRSHGHPAPALLGHQPSLRQLYQHALIEQEEMDMSFVMYVMIYAKNSNHRLTSSSVTL